MAQAPVRALPRVVACMPAWNSSAYVVPVLESLAAQTYPNLNILISVDVCSDDSAQICERFAATRDNVMVIHQRERLGWIGNCNALLERVDGDYALFAMHDDPLAPTYIAQMVDALEANPHAVLAFADMETTADEALSYDALDGVVSRFERARRVLYGGGPWWIPFRGLMRMSTVRSLGGLRRHLAGEYAADWPWLLRFVLAGQVVRVAERLVCKRIHSKSLSSMWRRGGWNGFGVVLDCMCIVRGAGFPLLQELYLHCGIVAFSIGLPACPSVLAPVKDAVRRRAHELSLREDAP
jgi:glycosyltransferase involved in cell wall biosynthesis